MRFAMLRPATPIARTAAQPLLQRASDGEQPAYFAGQLSTFPFDWIAIQEIQITSLPKIMANRGNALMLPARRYDLAVDLATGLTYIGGNAASHAMAHLPEMLGYPHLSPLGSHLALTFLDPIHPDKRAERDAIKAAFRQVYEECKDDGRTILVRRHAALPALITAHILAHRNGFPGISFIIPKIAMVDS